jgi:hypothetical protein
MNGTKKFTVSKTLWFNLLAALMLWVVPAVFPDFAMQVPEAWAPFELPVVLIVNFVLRLFTNKGITA